MRRGTRPLDRPADAPPPTPDALAGTEAERDLNLGFRQLAAQVVAQALVDVGSVNETARDVRIARVQARAFLRRDLFDSLWWEWLGDSVDRERLLRHVAAVEASRARRARAARRAALARWGAPA